jgi:hypothetical protein
MTAQINEPQLRAAFETMRNAGQRGRELAALLHKRGTRARISARVSGGFTLNFINTIFLQPPRENANESEFRRWVTLLAHEACHIEQGFWVDSVQQEIIAYQTQCRVARELEIDLGTLHDAFEKLNPALASDQRAAQFALTSIFYGAPAAVVYACLPLAQPRGARALWPGLRQMFAVLRAARMTRP